MEYPRAARRDANGNYVTPTWGRRVSYSYDAMGRPVGASDPDTGQTWVQQGQMNVAGQLTGFVLTAPTGWEQWSFQYNVRGQLTREKVVGLSNYGTLMDTEYRYSTTANDGRITQQKDWVSGEEVNYQYDELGRLIAAATTGPQWGLSWTYDGFGNRLSQDVTKGTAPVVSLSISAATNRITTPGFAYDAAGHMTQWPGGTVTLGADYDVEGRLSVVKQDGVQIWLYLYDARNRRVRKSNMSGTMPTYEVHGLRGELLGVYGWYWPLGAPSPVFRVEEERIYFAGRVAARLDETGSPNFGRLDQLGSVKAWQRYPFGEGNESSTNDQYATYPIDRSTGHYYAWNRFYSATWGRFSSPDPYVLSGGLTNPQGWNRYSYVGNDPVNYYDPEGLQASRPFFYWECWESNSEVGYSCALRVQMLWDGGTPGGPLDFLPQGLEGDGGGPAADGETTYERAVRIARYAATELSKKNKWRKDCDELLGSLGTSGAAISEAAGRVEFLQGPGSAELWSSLYANHPRLGPAAAAEHPNKTIGEFFAEQPNTKAMAELLGHKVYLNPKWWGKGYYDDMATVMHELIHNVTGLTDSDISRMLGEKPISEFSLILRDKCL